MPDRDEADEVDVLGHGEQRLDLGHLLGQHAVDAGGEPFVDRRELQEQERGPCVDVPVRRGPADLLAVAKLVRLPVALVVALLPRADEDMDRRGRDPRLAAGGDVLVLARQARELGDGCPPG